MQEHLRAEVASKLPPALAPMTDIDTDNARQLAEDSTGSHGLWRVLSLAAVLAGVALTALSLLQARDASNVQIPDFAPIALAKTNVTIGGDLPVTADQVAVLGLAHSESRQDFNPAGGTSVQLPQDTPSVIALYQADSALVGLAVTTDPTLDVEVTAESTAHALLVLSPGVLRPNIAQSLANVERIMEDASYSVLVDALRSNPNLSTSNSAVETAFAQIADRVPLKNPPADQGCDSVVQRDAYPATGMCVQPQAGGLLISNHQDRWVYVYDNDSDWSELCATISPESTTWDEESVDVEQCGEGSLVVAPGRVTLDGFDEEMVKQRLRTIAALNSLYEYVGPFADLAGGSAGYLGRGTNHFHNEATSVEDSLNMLVETNDQLATVVDVTLIESTARERLLASTTASRILIDAADVTSLIPHRTPGDSQHLALLDFYTRASDLMTSSQVDIRWEADALGQLSFGEDA